MMFKMSPISGRNCLKFGVLTGMVLVACSTSQKKEEPMVAEAHAPEVETAASIPSALDADENFANGDSDHEKAMGLETIHFPYDSSVLDGEAQRVADSNVQILKGQARLKVQIEGHCDQRGSIQYNLALGERRANVVKDYFVDAGIAQDRITVISFGKEKLFDLGSTDEAHAKNRRANFVITAH